MPNWAEGSLKLRGKKENIAQALKYMFCTADNVEIEEDLEIGWFELTTTASYFYINGTRRAFIKNNKLSFWLDSFVGGWLGGLAWASIASIKANETKKENEAMKRLIRQQNDVLTVTLNRERKLKEQMKEEKHG